MRYREDGTKNQYDVYKDGRQRVYKLWHPNDKPSVDWQWDEEHKEIGDQKTWYDNGQLKEVNAYNDKGVLQKTTSWHENGQKMDESIYQNGKLKEMASWYEDGKLAYRYEYDENGQKIEKTN